MILFTTVGMLILSEVLHHLWIEKILLSVDGSKYSALWQRQKDWNCVKLIMWMMYLICGKNAEKELATEFLSDLEHFINQASASNKQFRYWSTFLNELIPIVNYLTLSFRESNWLLYLSALRKAMPLFFAFDWSNYSWWALLY